MIIPANVESLYAGYSDYQRPFYNTPLLRELVYLSPDAPSGWYATSKTYVPNIEKYKSPTSSITDASILPILSTNESSFVYSGDIPKLGLSSNLKNNTLDFENPSLEKNVGKHNASIAVTISNEYISYAVSFVVQYNILPKEVIVSTPNVSREYGDINPEFVVNYDGLVNNESIDVFQTTATASTSARPTSNVGKYNINVSGAKANNYTFTYSSGELTIEPAPLKASVKSTSREYGNPNPNFTLMYEGLKNGETAPAWTESPIFNTTASILSPIGEYLVTASANPKNYILSHISDGILKVIPAKLRVVAQDKSRLYYEENPALTFYYNGFRNGETENIVSNTPSLSTTATLESNSGIYDINISNISSISAPNYDIEYKIGKLTIKPRQLSVSSGIYERAYGEENPAFNIQYEGFVADEDADDLITCPSAYTNATKTSTVGSYSINISGGEAINYNFNYVQGKLNIVKANQDIVWNQDLTNLAKGQQVELLAYSTSGLPVTYTVENTNICEIYNVGNKKYLDCIGAGEIQLRAFQEGNTNYNASPRVYKNGVIGVSTTEKPSLTITQLPIGTMSCVVDWGSIYTFKLSPNPGWTINSLSINGEDYTNRIDTNGIFTTPVITHDTKIIISYQDENTSISDTDIDNETVKIIGQYDGVRVLNATIGQNIYVYSIAGYLVKVLTADTNDVFIALPNDTTFIIKAGHFTGKIRL